MSILVGENVIFTFRKLSGGTPLTGLTVTVVVVDAGTGANLLVLSTMTEIVPGQYIFTWTNPPKTKVNGLATFTTQGKSYDEFFMIDNDDLYSRAT